MIKIVSIAVLGSLALAGAAAAEEAVISAPLQAGSLHEGPLDMVAYYRPLGDDGLELTATFRARTAEDEPMRVMMRLEDGDDVSFGMPGYRGSLYRFARSEQTISMAVEYTPPKVVSGPDPVLSVAEAVPVAIVAD